MDNGGLRSAVKLVGNGPTRPETTAVGNSARTARLGPVTRAGTVDADNERRAYSGAMQLDLDHTEWQILLAAMSGVVIGMIKNPDDEWAESAQQLMWKLLNLGEDKNAEVK